MKTFVMLLSLISLNAFAVETKNCPQQIVVSYASVKSLSDSQFQATHGRLQNGNVHDVQSYRGALQAQNALGRATRNEYQRLQFSIVEKKNSECRYVSSQVRAFGPNNTNHQLRLQTRSGRDFIRVPLEINGEIFWIFHTVAQLSPSDIKLQNRNGTVLGGNEMPSLQIGFANGLSL